MVVTRSTCFALLMIERLTLRNDEKTKAIRRLLERHEVVSRVAPYPDNPESALQRIGI